MKHYKKSIIAFVTTIILGVPWLISAYPDSRVFIDHAFRYIGDNIATVILRKPITITQLHDKYNAVASGRPRVHILLVPGHEPDYGGTEYKNLKERDIAVQLAEYLRDFLKANIHYDVVLSRNKDEWNPDLQKYFTENWNEIVSFVKESRTEMLRLINNGVLAKISDGVAHNTAPQNVAIRLYGINKWVNENNIDIAIHIHFNNYPRNDNSREGKYSGFAIYVPERQYSNSTTTRDVANAVFKRLAKYNAVSNLPREDAGVVEEQDLIAIGSYNTLDAPSMLIEYGYIYETQFNDPDIQGTILKDMAFQTYLGIQDFFGSGNDVSLAYDTLVLPYLWKGGMSKGSTDKNSVLALQTALLLDGTYPGVGKTKNDCPRTGRYGQCTANAVSNFQKKYGIVGEVEFVGDKTKDILNEKYSVQLK